MHFYRTLIFALSMASGVMLSAQTCPPLNLQSTPRIIAPDRQVVVTYRETDGTFTGYSGPRVAPLLVGAETPNLQTAITSCYPGPTRKGNTPFSVISSASARQGTGALLADYADLDGDGVDDAVLIAYKPNLVFVLLMAPSNVPKSGYPSPIVLPGPPLAVRIADVNQDGKPDLIMTAADSPNGSPLSSIYVALNNGNGTFSQPVRYAAGSNPLSFAVIDINGDKIPDLVVADQGSSDGSGTGGGVAVLIGSGSGSFSTPSFLQTANTAVTSVVVADFNGDGKPDIAAANGPVVSVFTGNGSGGFSTRATFPSGGDSTYLAFGDFNADGKMDLVSSNYNEQTASVLMNNGSGGFLAPVSYVISHGRSTDFLIVTDFNNDGIPDIIGGSGSPSKFAGNSNNALDVLLGNGDGTFAAPAVNVVGSTPIAFATSGDFNNDGKLDVVAMSQRSSTLYFYAGKGDGTFAAPVTTNLGSTFLNAIGGIAADFNGDKVPDLAILTSSGVSVALSLKNGSFQALTQVNPSATTISNIAVGDFNGDGKLDFATPICSTSGGPTALHIYNGSGTGAFTDSQPVRLNYCPSSLVGVDVNGDNRIDLLSLNNNGPSGGAYSSVDVLMNQGQGTFANPRGYGLDPTGIVTMTVADLNGDGKPDIIGASSTSKPYALTARLNNGDGTFGNPVSTPLTNGPLAIFGADLNGDQKADLIIAPSLTDPHQSYDLTSVAGNGDGSFQSVFHVAAPNTTGVQFADFNGDGRLDILATSTGVSPIGYFMVIKTGASPSPPPAAANTVNGASFTAGAPVAADSIASVFGSHLAVADNLAGTTVTVKDSAGASHASGTIFFVSAAQVNFQIPPGLPAGTATITVTAADGTATSGTFQIANVAPGMFATNAGGLYAGNLLRVKADGTQITEQNYQLDAGQNVIPLPVNLGSDQIFLIMYGTGIKHATTVTATVGNQNVPVAFAGAQGTFVSEDQVNIGPLPSSLGGSGKVNIVITTDGVAANPVNLTIQ